MGSRPAQNPFDQGLSPSSGSQRERIRQEGSVILLYAPPGRGCTEATLPIVRTSPSFPPIDRDGRCPPRPSQVWVGLEKPKPNGGVVRASQQCSRRSNSRVRRSRGTSFIHRTRDKTHNSAGGRACDALPTCPSVNTVSLRRMELTSLGEEGGITPAHGQRLGLTSMTRSPLSRTLNPHHLIPPALIGSCWAKIRPTRD